MTILRTLFIGQNPPGINDDTLLEYLKEYLKIRSDSYGNCFGVLTIYISTIPRFINCYQDFILDLESVAIDTEQQYAKLENHFHIKNKRVRDMRFATDTASSNQLSTTL